MSDFITSETFTLEGDFKILAHGRCAASSGDLWKLEEASRDGDGEDAAAWIVLGRTGGHQALSALLTFEDARKLFNALGVVLHKGGV